MAVGVSFGGGELGSAVALAIGIGLQNVPEGLAIALPLRRGEHGLARQQGFPEGVADENSRHSSLSKVLEECS
jgi:ZIP family zinc transporter